VKDMLNHEGTKQLQTERLILRKFTEEDAEVMYNNWASDSEVTKYLTWPIHSSVEVTKKVLNRWVHCYNNLEFYQWAIELKESGKIIGSISLINIDNDIENCELGYCIGKTFWNRGIVTEAVSAIIDFAFTEVVFKRISARHHVDNTPSGKVMEKCGLKYEGLLKNIIKDGNGILVDCKYYSILNCEYLSTRV
jgi:ribosomal-protein-alanine N-acetyltransferase